MTALTQAQIVELCTRTVGDVLVESAHTYGASTFLIADEARMSFAEVNQAVDRSAAGLLRIGIRKGDHVGLWLGNSIEWVIWFFACARIGAAVVPVSTRYKAEEMVYVVAHADCRALIIGPPRWGIDFYELLLSIAPELAHQSSGNLALARLPSLRHVLIGTNGDRPGTQGFIALLADSDTRAVAAVRASVRSSDLLLISYTSGTTGAPKGVMHSHKVVTQATKVGCALRMEPGDTVLGHMPFYHVAGLFMALIPATVLGASLAILDEWRVDKALAVIEREGVRIFGGIPTHFHDLANEAALSNYNLSSLKSAWIGGSSCSPEMFDRFQKRIGIPKLLSTYGMTENTISTTFNRWDDPIEIASQNKSPVLADCEVAIVDPESGCELPIGKDGEIWCRGSTVMLGYYKNPEATREAINPEGWLRTGDMGRFDEGGYLSITGRRKDMFKIGGTNAYPAEIEQHLAKHTDVLMSAVVGVPDDRMGEVGYAFVLRSPESDLSEKDVIDHCRGRIADYKVPRYVRFVDDFPRTPSGKIKKFELIEAARLDVSSRRTDR